MRSTARDFWKMVYSRKCSVVVMLSDLIEQNEVTLFVSTYKPQVLTPSLEISIEFTEG